MSLARMLGWAGGYAMADAHAHLLKGDARALLDTAAARGVPRQGKLRAALEAQRAVRANTEEKR